MNKLLGDRQVCPDTIEMMQKSESNHSETRWVAFQNQAMDSVGLGHIRFLATGPMNTFQEIPKNLPDGSYGAGWKYVPVGYVNLETGLIEESNNE